MEVAEIRSDYRKLKLIVTALRDLEVTYGEIHIFVGVQKIDIPMVSRLRDELISRMKAAYVSERQVINQAAIDAAIAAEG